MVDERYVDFVDNIELAVIDANDWWCRCVLIQHVSLLQTDGQPKVFAGLEEAIHQQLQFSLGVNRDCDIVSEQHVSDEGFADVCPRFKAGKIEDPTI